MPLTDLSRGTLKRASETGQPAKRLQPHARLWETGTKLNPMLQSPAMLAPTAADLADNEATVPLRSLRRPAKICNGGRHTAANLSVWATRLWLYIVTWRRA